MVYGVGIFFELSESAIDSWLKSFGPQILNRIEPLMRILRRPIEAIAYEDLFSLK